MYALDVDQDARASFLNRLLLRSYQRTKAREQHAGEVTDLSQAEVLKLMKDPELAALALLEARAIEAEREVMRQTQLFDNDLTALALFHLSKDQEHQ